MRSFFEKSFQDVIHESGVKCTCQVHTRSPQYSLVDLDPYAHQPDCAVRKLLSKWRDQASNRYKELGGISEQDIKRVFAG